MISFEFPLDSFLLHGLTPSSLRKLRFARNDGELKSYSQSSLSKYAIVSAPAMSPFTPSPSSPTSSSRRLIKSPRSPSVSSHRKVTQDPLPPEDSIQSLPPPSALSSPSSTSKTSLFGEPSVKSKVKKQSSAISLSRIKKS
jgi:hypothetical protein